MDQGEIIIYHIDNQSFQLEVRIADETVWLNRHQIAILFNRDIKTIGKHIANAKREELQNISVVAKFATTASDGKSYQVEHYNLDMILSVGYRVKSERGILFRRWANNILKNYLMKGYVVHSRIQKIEDDVYHLKKKAEDFDLHIKSTLPPHEGIFYEGQIYDAWQFVTNIIKHAKTSITIIDNYIDDTVLTLLSKRNENVTAIIYTANISKQLKTDLEKFNAQFKPFNIRIYNKSHDRFLIIDNNTVYHIGASLKDLGNKWFAFSKIRIDASEMIKKLEND